jgi:Zn finger protein HypA/HybF involved in hydrogenase expression
MEKCKKCGNDFTPQKGLKSYCSLACRNSRERSEETKQKISIGVSNSEKFIKGIIDRNKLIDYKQIGKQLKEIANNKILDADFSTLSYERLKKRIVLEQSSKCNHCGINSWNGKPITLELEHKDGNHSNNQRDNLEAICPNCHSQTETWRGRNKQNKRNKVSDDEIVKAYIKTNNIRQTLLEVGLVAKGGNYNRIYSIIRKYSL